MAVVTQGKAESQGEVQPNGRVEAAHLVWREPTNCRSWDALLGNGKDLLGLRL